MASFSAGVPPTSVYRVWPAAMARIADSLMCSGVSKSGSPAVRLRMSRPKARSSRARWPAMELGEGLMRWSRGAI